jgi:hypothetical protein
MTNTPATSGEEMASSLFQSGPEADAPAASASADAGAPAPSGGPVSASGPGPGPSSSGPGGKLSAVASISGGNSGSMTAGNSTHSKFFGSGNQEAKFAAPLGADLKKAASSGPDKKEAVTAMLNSAVAQSQMAAKAPNMDSARGDATTAFGGGSKGASSSDLNGKAEESSAVSGLTMGAAAADLKKSDPSINKTKVSPPKLDTDANTKQSEDEQMKQMIIQMIIKAALGMAFG